MGLDPASIAQGVVSGYATQKTLEKANEVLHPDQRNPQDEMIYWLERIHDAIAPPEKESRNESFQLQPYPSEYIVPDDFYGHAHVCVFFYAANVPVRFDGVFGGSYTRNIGPGWFQLDVPGRLSVNGGAINYPVIVSYRDDALGGSF